MDAVFPDRSIGGEKFRKLIHGRGCIAAAG
jgi:hypothetical protein